MTNTASDGPASHAFGRWRFDAGPGDLFDGTTTIRLEPQVAKLLNYFLNHQDTLINRSELMAAVWEKRIVSDDAINRCISILRQTLSPDDKNAYIETVVRRGFISHFPPPFQDTASVEQTPRRGKHWTLGALAAVAVLVIFGAVRMPGDSRPRAGGIQPSDIPMVAILPFISAGVEGDSEFFARACTTTCSPSWPSSSRCGSSRAPRCPSTATATATSARSGVNSVPTQSSKAACNASVTRSASTSS
jgi:DNA-binding winged helix-turn-helix (wHTH) protein